MTIGEIADKLLQHILVQDKAIGSNEAAILFNVTEEQLIQAARMIKQYDSSFIVIRSGYGRNQLQFLPDNDEGANVFLIGGGLTALEEESDKREVKALELENLQKENLQATTADANNSITTSKQSIRLARASLAVSVLALLLALIALIRG